MNRLHLEDSPYLKQHEKNPVFWFPWGEEALLKAKNERKPIFISIGYSTCHWCHVMEREIFEKDSFADRLNKDFVSIKIDKEERPDIDKYYQEIYHILNKRSGGWPLSMFLTHELKPFFAGTYIPPTPQRGMIGFNQLLDLILEKYQTNYEDLVKTGNTLTEFMGKERTNSSKKPSLDLEKNIITHLKKSYDKKHGGFTAAPKFPHCDLLNFVLRSKDRELLDMGEETLMKMSQGGLYDLVEGGFCRYSVDEMWLVPHFEKMLYDNALLTQIMVKGYFLYKNEVFKNIATETGDFFISSMSDGVLFYSASDADTEGEEGKYFVYSYDELEKEGISKDELAQLDVTKEGNFEGKNIIRGELSDKSRGVLQKIREKRVHPFIDKKVVVFQNAMMIKTLFLLSKIDEKYTEIGVRSLEALIENFYKNGELFRTKIGESKGKIQGFLEDYSYFCEALFTAFIYTAEKRYFHLSKEVLEGVIEKFSNKGNWYFSKGDFPTYADIYDNAYPSSIGVIISLCKKFALFDEKFLHIVESSIANSQEDLERAPFACTTFYTGFSRNVIKLSGKKEELNAITKGLDPLILEDLVLEINQETSLRLCDDRSCFFQSEEREEIIKEIEKRYE